MCSLAHGLNLGSNSPICLSLEGVHRRVAIRLSLLRHHVDVWYHRLRVRPLICWLGGHDPGCQA